jgi:hypothetical protein
MCGICRLDYDRISNVLEKKNYEEFKSGGFYDGGKTISGKYVGTLD